MEYFQAGASDPKLPFSRLVAIRIPGKHDGGRLPGTVFEETIQQGRGVFLDEDLAFKIQAGPVPPVLVGVPRITVDASVFATLVGVHAVGHAHIRAGNLVDDGFWVDAQVAGADLLGFPADPLVLQKILQGLLLKCLKAVCLAGLGPAAFADFSFGMRHGNWNLSKFMDIILICDG